MSPTDARSLVAAYDPVLAQSLDDAAAVNTAHAIQTAADGSYWTGMLAAALTATAWAGYRYKLPAVRRSGVL